MTFHAIARAGRARDRRGGRGCGRSRSGVIGTFGLACNGGGHLRCGELGAIPSPQVHTSRGLGGGLPTEVPTVPRIRQLRHRGIGERIRHRSLDLACIDLAQSAVG